MLNTENAKPHHIKWIEAERELAARWIFIPHQPIGHGYFPIHDKYPTWHPDMVFDPPISSVH